jgi:signal transduction histidine kinase
MRRKDIFTASKRNIICLSIGMVVGSLIVFAVITQLFYKARLFEDRDQQLLTHKNRIMKENIIKKKGEAREVVMPAPMTPNLISYVWEENVLLEEGPRSYSGERVYLAFPTQYDGEPITLTSGGDTYRALGFEKEGLRIDLLINVDAELHSVKQLQRSLFVAFLILMLAAFVLASYLAAAALKPVKGAYEKQLFFVQDASHEMRTPLAIIKGQIELLACHTNDSVEEHLEGLSDIIKEVRSLEKLNRDLFTLSKEEGGAEAELENFSLNSFLEEIQEFYLDLAEVKQREFTIQKAVPDREVTWDRLKVKRCLTILLENAFKYTHTDDVIQLIADNEGKSVIIQVIDSGIGIKEEEKSRIFDRFFRSNEVRGSGIEGSGIGLSLLKALAYSMEIKVDFKSQYGAGSEFTLTLPEKMKN